MAKYEIKPMMGIQLPIPLAFYATLLLPIEARCCSLILISSPLVKRENKGANGKDVAKKATKPN